MTYSEDANVDDAIAIVIEGEIIDDPTEAVQVYRAIVERFMKEMPDEYRTPQNTGRAVVAMIRKENLFDHGIDAEDFTRFWEAVVAIEVALPDSYLA